MRILHLLAPAPVGGLESVVQALAEGHARRHEVHAALVLSDDGERAAAQPYARALAGAGVRVHAVHAPPRAYRTERSRVAELCGAVRPDVVHTHGLRCDAVDGPVARRLGIATVSTVHGYTGGGWRLRLSETIQRRGLRQFDAVVAVSQPLARRLRAAGIPPERLHVIPNARGAAGGLLSREEARRHLGIADDQFHVGWVGRLSEEKGPDVLLDAVARLRDLPLTVSVLGAGPEQDRLREQAHALGIAELIRWHGVVPDAAALFPAFDALALSSRTEGTPIVLLEAMAACVPVVASAVGGVPDMLSAAEATLVPPQDPGALAAALRAVAADPAAAAARADAARTRLDDQFALEPWLDRYEQLYEDVQT